MQEFTPCAPCASSELVHFRNRIGEKGIELIFQESIRVNNEEDDDHHHDTAFYRFNRSSEEYHLPE